MDRSSSFSSAASGTSASSAGSSVASRGGTQPRKQADDEDLLEQNATFQAGVFGVLYTLSKEKYDSSKRFSIIKLVLDFIQFFLLIVNEDFGWNVDEGLWIWKLIAWAKFSNPVTARGYTMYIAILYIIVAALMISVLLCIWVGWCFKNDSFPYVWPIKVLRLVVATFFMIFYIGSLAVFMVALNCQWFVDGPEQYYLKAFPDVRCLEMPHLANGIIALVSTLLFCGIASAMVFADFEMSPVSNRWLATPHTMVEIRGLLVKTIMTVTVAVLYSKVKIQALIMSSLSWFLLYSYIRWQPHLNQWVNHCRCGLYGMVAWAGLILLVLAFSGDDLDGQNLIEHHQLLTTVLFAGLGPAAVVGFATSFLRLRYSMKKAIKSFIHIKPDVQRLRDIYRFHDPYEVEMTSRVCRKYLPEDDEVLDPNGVKLAEWMLKVGLAFFPQSVFMVITYSNFLIEVMGNNQSGSTQLQLAKKLNPGVSDKFAIFVREQEHKQKSQGQTSGENASDLVSYVEFQRNFRLLMKTHKQSLTATKAFWKKQLHRNVSFCSLAASLKLIDGYKTKADKTFKTVLERYPSSVKLLRSYGRFLEEVKNDPWTAEKYFNEAEKQEEQQESNNQDVMLGNGEDGAAVVDEKNDAVVVINAQGIIQMSNKLANKLFGYKRGELEAKNVSILMPPPFNQRHNTYLRNYLNTGKAKIIDSVREVVGVHKERHVFPCKVAVTKMSGNGVDALFMGVLKPAEDNDTVVKMWIMPTGAVVCVDARFHDWFGKTSLDVGGRNVSSLLVEQEAMMKLLDSAQSAGEREFQQGRIKIGNVHFHHKFTDPVAANIQFELGGTESQRLLVALVTKVDTSENNMLVADGKGRILYMNSDLRAILDLEARALKNLQLSNLMGQPYASLHARWMKDPSARVPMQSCRNGATVTLQDSKGEMITVRAQINTREDGDVTTHIVNINKVTWDQGLDERRLMLVIDGLGNILETGETPMALFGFKPNKLLGMNVTKIVDVLHVHSADIEDIIAKMVHRNADEPGCSWRVGVHPPVSDDADSQSDIAKAVLAKNTKASLMQVEMIESEDMDVPPVIRMALWRADGVTGVVEMDKDTVVTKPACCALHPTGMLFGCSNNTLLRQHLRNFAEFPGRGAESLLADKKTKGAMKSGTTGRKIGPEYTINAVHTDGKPLQLKITAVAASNRRVVAKVNFAMPLKGDPKAFLASLTNAQPATMGRARATATIGFGNQKAGPKKGGVKFFADDDPLEEHHIPDHDTHEDNEEEHEHEHEEPQAEGMNSMFQGGMDDEDDMMEEEHPGNQADWDAAGTSAYQADYKRGKRYRKLLKMLTSTMALEEVNRYRTHSWMILALVLLTHVACFVVFLIELAKESQHVKEVDGCGFASYYMQRIHVGVRAIGNMYSGLGNPLWYEMDATPKIPQDVLDQLESDIDNMEMYHHSLYLGFTKLRHLGTDYELNEIWEGNLLNQTTWLDTRVPEFNTDSDSSLWLMGLQYIASAREILHNHEILAQDWGNDLTLSRDWEYVNKNGPGSIYSGYKQALDAFVLKSRDLVTDMQLLVIILLIIQGVIVGLISVAWTYFLIRSVNNQRYALYLVFLLTPSGLLRALASKQIQMEGAESDDSDVEEDAGAKNKQQADAGLSSHAALASGKALTLDLETLMPRESLGHQILTTLNPTSWFKTNFIDMGKKKLVQDNHDPALLSLPYLLWALIVIIIFVIIHINLDSVSEEFTELYVFNRIKVKSIRGMVTAHELLSNAADRPDLITSLRTDLDLRQSDFTLEYDAFLYGTETLAASSFSEVRPALFSSKIIMAPFFKAKDRCYVINFPERYCFTEEDQYYKVSNNGLDPMVRRLLEEQMIMASDAVTDINFTSPRFDYIWRVAYQGMLEGILVVNSGLTAEVNATIKTAQIIYIAWFAVSLVLVIIFVYFIYRPYIEKIRAESRQIAELLSQLPTDMDVEALVTTALNCNGKEESAQNQEGQDEVTTTQTQKGSKEIEHQDSGDDNASVASSMN